MPLLRKAKSASSKAAEPAATPGRTQDASAASSPSSPNSIEPIIERYGDLLYDLCESVLWGSSAAQVVLRSIFRELRAERKFNMYSRHERAWVLRVACERLRDLSRDHARKLTSSEQLELDSNEKASARLRQFDFYFHRLPINEQMVLLLRDKYGLPYPEISAALGLPEGSLKVRKQQALRALEDWIWDE